MPSVCITKAMEEEDDDRAKTMHDSKVTSKVPSAGPPARRGRAPSHPQALGTHRSKAAALAT